MAKTIIDGIPITGPSGITKGSFGVAVCPVETTFMAVYFGLNYCCLINNLSYRKYSLC